MNIKWKVISSVMLLIATICTVFILIVQKQQDAKIEELIAGKTESAVLLAETILSNMSRGYQRRAIAFTNPKASQSREQMIRAFADRDREKLLQLSKPFYAILQKDSPYFTSLGWILPNNEVFLRVHSPERFGKSVNWVRSDIAAANSDKQQHTGFQTGITSLQYRIVQPVYYDETYLGIVQFGIKASIIFDALQERLHTIAGMAILNKECDIAHKSPMPKLRCNTHTIRARDVSMFEPLQKELDWTKPQQRVLLNGREHVILNVVALNDFQNQELGFFFVALDISKEIAQKQQLIFSIFFLSSFLFLLSFVILYISYGSLIQKIINLNETLETNNLELEDRIVKRTISLQESTERLQKILNNAPIGILIADTNTMELQYANPAICTMLGYTKTEMKSMTVASLHKPESNAQVLKRFKKMADGKNETAINIPFLRKDGTQLEADVITASIELKEKSSLIGFIVDRTEMKKLGKQLLRAQKMEAIGLMAGGVAHDLNNILAGIVSYPELILLQLPESSVLRQPVQAIQESGKRAATVVADLLTVARGVASTREPHNIHLLIDEYLNSPEYKNLSSLHPDVLYSRQFTATAPTISCSPMHIKKIVMNLVTNALEAVKDSGNVNISTCNRHIEEGESSARDLAPGEYLVLAIEDDGTGIAAKDLEHIFEPFYTKKIMGQSGTGLGLAVVWNTVQDHNGRIVVNSNDQGTRFEIYFPVTEAKEHDPQKTDKSEKIDHLSGNNEHLLVVDDEAQLRDIATQLLENLGYRVDSVSSGEQAIQFIKDSPVDLIILDMLMEPGINGRRTYEEILKLQPEQKAIIASGFSESDEVKSTLQLGATTYIKKPYSMEKLGQAVKKSLRNNPLVTNNRTS